MKKLQVDFYDRDDVVLIAQELIGKVLCTNVDGIITKGIITETEAYAGTVDKASHAHGGKRTDRTEIMFGKPGISYVYLCYGVHSLFNVVTNKKDIPHAVLVRGIHPLEGIETIVSRRKTKEPLHRIADGPGKLTKALGIEFRQHNNLDLLGDTVWIEDHSIAVNPTEIEIGPRIGIDYAEEDALLPYRFRWKNPETLS
ncbi:MAG: DNA-3-methyladenine glycosylase [Flavobacteriales bacterium]|nr:DNA-3-methyladenine glycosylase [Flavobacteriales bacterium]